MSKGKINFNQKTKLAKVLSQQSSSEEKLSSPSGLISKKKNATKIKTFRMRVADINTLASLKSKINESPKIRKQYSESEILRGCLLFANDKAGVDQLLRCIQEASS